MANVFSWIDRVTFELSNYCNYAKIHPKCPAHNETNIRSISSAVVKKVLEYLGEHKYSRILAWHQYSEPLLDPRLFSFLSMAKQHCPDSKKLIWTNGSNLDQMMLDELDDAGVTNLVVTAYFNKEKFQSFKAKTMTYQVMDPGWVDVLDVYDRPLVESNKRCWAPYTDLIVTIDGKVGLCCRDVERRYTFGNLNEMTMEEVVNLPELVKTYEELSAGIRSLPICQQCGIYRSWRPAVDGKLKVGRLQ